MGGRESVCVVVQLAGAESMEMVEKFGMVEFEMDRRWLMERSSAEMSTVVVESMMERPWHRAGEALTTPWMSARC